MIRSKEILDQSVYLRIKEMIVNKELKPGECIVQNQLSKNLGVSRTPLRMALGELEMEGLLEKTAKGWFVKEFTLNDMISVLEIRAVLEGLAIRLSSNHLDELEIAYMRLMFEKAYKSIDGDQSEAYYKADIKFHNMITEHAGDPILKKTIDSNQIITTSLMQGLYRDPKETYPEHLEMIDALEAKDGTKAEVIMRLHIQKAAEELKSGQYFIYK